MIVLAAVVRIVDGKSEEFEKEFHKLAARVRKDPGVVTYVINRHITNPNQYFVYEKYEDEKAVEYHRATPHFKKFVENTGPIMAGPIEVNTYRESDI